MARVIRLLRGTKYSQSRRASLGSSSDNLILAVDTAAVLILLVRSRLVAALFCVHSRWIEF